MSPIYGSWFISQIVDGVCKNKALQIAVGLDLRIHFTGREISHDS